MYKLQARDYSNGTMQPTICPDCGTEMEPAEIREPVGDGITLRRKRSYCPECGPPENTTVDRSSSASPD